MSSAQSSPITVRFPSGDGECEGDLWTPAGDGPFPAVILGHGLGATRDMGLAAYAERFVAAGYAALTFDYRHYGGSTGEPRQLLSVRRRHEDFASALRFAQRQASIDPRRIAAWGSSLGGGHVIGIAAEGQGFGAFIAQCPFTDGPASARTLGPISTVKVSGRAIADAVGSLAGRPPIQVRTAGGARDAALMTAPDVIDGYGRLVAVAAEHDSGMPARAGLRIPLYRPGSRMKKIKRPILICVAGHDTVAPTATTRRLIRRAKNPLITEIVYPYGHFDIYFDAPFEQLVTDQLAFLQRIFGR